VPEAFIFGAGGLGLLVHDTLRQIGHWRVSAFLDSNPALHGRRIDGVLVAGGMESAEALARRGVCHAIVAIGFNETRARIAADLRTRNVELISAIHPLANIAPSAQIGEHALIGPRATVCVHARIGPHVVISAAAIVEHDNVLGSGVFLHPAARLAGGVRVDDFATIGIGASVIPGRRIGTAARVEPGSVVIADVPPHAIVSGIPARFLQPRGAFEADTLPVADRVTLG
jgi:sugar O-acyltransferase (sialic acid O-acetyltransferase NeuD family)